MNFKDKTLLITGGCSGIGKLMATLALEKNIGQLVILDINESAFPQLKEEWKNFEIPIYTYGIDLSQVEQIKAVSEKIKSEVGIPDILINNAGIVVGKLFHEQSHEEIDLAMAINTQALMHLTRCFLPEMMERNSGHICNIASSAGLISNPKMSVYAASKWAVVGWGDSVRLEMKRMGMDIFVTTIMPYFINTGMFDGVKSKLLPILNPEEAAEKFIRAIEKEKKLYATPLPYWFIRLTQGLLPLPIYEWVMDKVFGIYDTMSEFTGRS